MTTSRALRLPRVPKGLTVNALALMTATIGANGLGLVFWAVAAHLRPPDIVGQASAAVAALTLLSMIAQLNLTNVIVRLLPAAGRLGTYLVGRPATSLSSSCPWLPAWCTAPAALAVTSLTGGWAQYVEFTVAVPVTWPCSRSKTPRSPRCGWRRGWRRRTSLPAIARIVLLPVLFVTAMGAVWSAGVSRPWRPP